MSGLLAAEEWRTRRKPFIAPGWQRMSDGRPHGTGRTLWAPYTLPRSGQCTTPSAIRYRTSSFENIDLDDRLSTWSTVPLYVRPSGRKKYIEAIKRLAICTDTLPVVRCLAGTVTMSPRLLRRGTAATPLYSGGFSLLPGQLRSNVNARYVKIMDNVMVRHDSFLYSSFF